ncbi:MAG: magnesium chelatase domain-containing protein, partial [Limisphaerales bacterium]
MSLAQLYSASLQGIHAQPVNVEVHIGAGDFSTVIVGLPDIAIRESRDRVMTAIQTSGFAPPKGRTTINLAPADLRKEGPSFDLPMALGLLGATDQLPSDCLKGVLCIGELALDGSIRPVRGALSIALLATQAGFSKLMLPEANALEAAQVDSLDIWAVKHLRHACEILQGRSLPTEISLLDAPSESGQGLEFQPDL